MKNKQGQVILTTGFEAGSDYCGGCSGKKPNQCFCNIHYAILTDEFGHMKTFRCQQCKDSEQAAKQMIPSGDVENILTDLKKLFKYDQDKYYDTFEKEMCVNHDVGLFKGISKIKELLNQTKE